MILSNELQLKYSQIRDKIKSRLEDFRSIPREKYFYELCYCLCTPQSKAQSAQIVQNELEKMDFLNQDFDPVGILRNKNNYIRFHNQKSIRLIEIKNNFDEILKCLDSTISANEKRDWLFNNIKGLGMKESSHFLRNIGYRNLAILDRHILKHLNLAGVYDEIPKIKSQRHYLEIEERFREFSQKIDIPIDQLDLLFWSNETGEILK